MNGTMSPALRKHHELIKGGFLHDPRTDTYVDREGLHWYIGEGGVVVRYYPPAGAPTLTTSNVKLNVADMYSGNVKLTENSKQTNPKDLIGSDKLNLHLFPQAAVMLGSLAFLEGALKYGRSNWRVAGVRASVYFDACHRHLLRWFEGEDIDPDSGIHHLGKAVACLAILVDAMYAEKLVDDRMVPGGTLKALEDLTPKVAELRKRYGHLNPEHFTIQTQKESQ